MATVAEEWDHDTRAFWMMALAIVAVTASVLLLSATGIYAVAVMAFVGLLAAAGPARRGRPPWISSRSQTRNHSPTGLVSQAP